MAELNQIKMRVIDQKLVPRKLLVPHPDNPWKHGEGQRSMLLDMVGKLGFNTALMVRSLPDGNQYQILDGELRQSILEKMPPDYMVPVTVTDYNDEEAAAVVRKHNIIAMLSETEEAELKQLLERTKGQFGSMEKELDELAKESEEGGTKTLRQEMPVEPLGQLRWILIGLPVGDFAKAQPHIAALEQISTISVQKTGEAPD